MLDGPQEFRSKIVDHVLPTIIDPGDYSISSTQWANGPWEVNIYPVRNIETFSRKIRFGRINRIQGRRIYITIDKSSAEISIATAMTIKFIEKLPRMILTKSREVRFLLISYCTGQDYNKLLAEDLWNLRRPRTAIGK